ncbi:hypothetical protein [Sinomonas mesophila]|uniref:hypothetical protein n=1 Tax=Sinomonas mesophila TaxID=1531955 RepID=UPI000987C18F|nr:hypothetical protein [Sinomonas mesophila]
MSTQDYGPVAEKQGPAVGTIVWGAVVMAVGALILADRLGWLHVEPGYAAAGVMLLAGLGLVVGGLIAAGRRRRSAADGGVPAGGAQGADGGASGSGATPTAT